MIDLAAVQAKPPRPGLSQEQRQAGRSRLTKPREDPAEIELTEDQSAALEALLEFEASDDKTFLLSGWAGTGKTTVLQHYLKITETEAALIGGRIHADRVLAAPTNKAVRVLAEMASAHGLSVPCLTLHSLLGLRLRKDAEQKYCDAGTWGVDLTGTQVLVVDECSMVGNEPTRLGRREVPGLFSTLMNAAVDSRTKVVFVGDPGQLPPVKDGKLSPTFNTLRRFELKEIVRQAEGNPILRLASYIRAVMAGEAPARPNLADDGFTGVYATRDLGEFEDLVVEAYLDESNHPTRYKALAYRNRTVDMLNDRVRREIHGPEAEKYLVGERYVATQPVVDVNQAGMPSIVAATDEDAVILSIEATQHEDLPQYRAFLLAMKGSDGSFPAVVPHPNDEQRWRADLKGMAELARKRRVSWEQYWSLHDAFAHFKPHYAMTAHRSQGSTYENVFVDVPDIMSNPSGKWEALRCLYTACTRAAQMLYLYEG